MKVQALFFVLTFTLQLLRAELPGRTLPIFAGAPEPGIAAKASPLSPGEERASFTMPPGFEVELVASESEGIGKFITVDWDQRGRMWSMTAFDYPVDGNENPAAAKALYDNPGKDKVLVFDTPFAPGVQTPRVFADGLAIPLGVLPFQNGVYVQHGPQIVYLRDSDGDGKADQREVMLSGFGVQDSHLFAHQFTRAPGNWMWIAQGAFNSGKVKTSHGDEIQFNATRMARLRFDGSAFDITSQGPCNIWGLVLGAEGEAWIQEANDYGFSAMPFHQYANYAGCSNGLFKSYAPEFPGTPGMTMGGTGLSGLALSDRSGAWLEPYADVMYVANPITRRINALKIHRDGPRYRLEKLPDFLASSDEWFRPIAIHFGPDGCLYIVDWYNKIISHNEVARNHPDRDKTRGRIWRVKATGQKPFAMADFTQVGGDDLLARLGGDSLKQSHLAWQAITDRKLTELAPKLRATITDGTQPAAKRIASLWALEGLAKADAASLQTLLSDANRNLRREAVRAFGEARLPELLKSIAPLSEDADPEVRAEVIRAAGALIAHPWSTSFPKPEAPDPAVFALLVKSGREPLAGPMAPSTHNRKPIKVGEAYDREFERYLVRLFLEQQPEALAKWLDSEDAKTVPVESRLLASLALEPKASAIRVAQLLPELTRPPGEEEVLRLALFPELPGVTDALVATWQNPATCTAVLKALIEVRTRLDVAKIAPLLEGVARQLFGGEDAGRDLAMQLAASFKLTTLEPELLAVLNSAAPAKRQLAALRVLREMGSVQADLFAKLAKNAADPLVRDEALSTLAFSKSEGSGKLLLALWPDLSASQRRTALDRLPSTKAGASAVVEALKSGTIPKTELDGPTVEKLQVVLGDDPDLAGVMRKLEGLFRPVLVLDGSAAATADADLTLEGPFTVETWVRLDPGIGNGDGILGSPGVLDMNFYADTFRVWAGPSVNDAIVAKRPITPNLWTHLAVTRDEKGLWKIYLDGTLDTAQSKPAPGKFERLKIGSAKPGGGTAGALSEFRVWNRVRTGDEIGREFDRSFEGQPRPAALVFYAPGAGPWGKLGSGAKLAKTNDFPPLMTTAEATALDAKFDRVHALAIQPGNAARGKDLAALCTVCHLIQGQGGNLGPNLTGAGAMGVEALLRNILTPNAAMEAGYRIFRVEMKNGDLVEGFFVSEDQTTVILRFPGAQDRQIAQKDIRSAKYLRRSLMPEGLLDAMQPQDVTNLFSYLLTLK